MGGNSTGVKLGHALNAKNTNDELETVTLRTGQDEKRLLANTKTCDDNGEKTHTDG